MQTTLKNHQKYGKNKNRNVKTADFFFNLKNLNTHLNYKSPKLNFLNFLKHYFKLLSLID